MTVFGCRSPAGERTEPGLRLVGGPVENDNRQPRYRAEGREIVTVHTGRRQTPPKAREALFFMVEGILATQQDDLVDSDILRAGDLIRAIREAERNDPTPPAAAAVGVAA
jgi:hypothetical protein